MSNPQRLAESPSSRATADALAFEVAASSRPRPVSGVSKKPRAAVAPSEAPRGGGAETKLYQVPRELIEIARANARNRAAHVGTLTPIAPRPDGEGEANAQAYAAQVSLSPRAPTDLRSGSEPTLAIESSLASEPSPAHEPSAVGPAPQAAADAAPSAAVEVSAAPAAAAVAGVVAAPAALSAVGPLRACVYAGLLVALGYCASLVSWPW